MPAILDNQGHLLGWKYDSRVIIRHKGRTVTVDSGAITIVCEDCSEPVAVFIDTSYQESIGLAATK